MNNMRQIRLQIALRAMQIKWFSLKRVPRSMPKPGDKFMSNLPCRFFIVLEIRQMTLSRMFYPISIILSAVLYSGLVHASEIESDMRTYFLLLKDPHSTESSVVSAAQQFAADHSSLERSAVFATMLETLVDVQQSDYKYLPSLMKLMSLLIDNFAFTDEEIWIATQSLLDYRSPGAIDWLARFFLTKPDFSQAANPGWNGERYVDYLMDPQVQSERKLILWYILLKWNGKFALTISYDVFQVPATRRLQLEEMFENAKSLLFSAGPSGETARQAITTLAQQPEAWVCLLVTVKGFWQAWKKELRPVLEQLSQDEVEIVKKHAKDKLSYFPSAQ